MNNTNLISEADILAIPTAELQKAINELGDESASATTYGDWHRVAELDRMAENLKFALRWKREKEAEANAKTK